MCVFIPTLAQKEIVIRIYLNFLIHSRFRVVFPCWWSYRSVAAETDFCIKLKVTDIMALPTLRSAWFGGRVCCTYFILIYTNLNQVNPLFVLIFFLLQFDAQRAIAIRREQEALRQQNYEQSAQFFRQNSFRAAKQQVRSHTFSCYFRLQWNLRQTEKK